jgi:hypothetical protein
MAQTVRVEQAMREFEQHLIGLQPLAERYEWLIWYLQQTEQLLKELNLIEEAKLEGADLVEAIVAGSRLSVFAHQHYLPAVHAYRAYQLSSAGHAHHGHVARSLQSRYAAQSKQLYVAQRPVFNVGVKILLGVGGFALGSAVASSGFLGIAAAGAFLATPKGKSALQRLWAYVKHLEARYHSLARTTRQ